MYINKKNILKLFFSFFEKRNKHFFFSNISSLPHNLFLYVQCSTYDNFQYLPSLVDQVIYYLILLIEKDGGRERGGEER